MSVVFYLSNTAQIKDKMKFVYTRKDGMLYPHTTPKKHLIITYLHILILYVPYILQKLICITNFTCTKYVHLTL